MKSFTIERMKVRVYKDRSEMGAAAAEDAASRIRELLGKKERVRMAFAAAPSQGGFLDWLARARDLDWGRVTAFQLDEYVGVPGTAPQSHQSYLRERLFSRVKPGEVHSLDGSAHPRKECARYAELVRQGPLDIVCLGIGNNGHIALNEPHAADFNDPDVVKVVELDKVSIKQQVQTGIFKRIEDVPRFGMTLTVPVIMSATHLFCVVPGPSKRDAVRLALQGPLTTACPASILRTHPDCTLFLELDSHGK